MTGSSDRARQWWRHEGRSRPAVLTVVYLALLAWGIGAGWDTGVLAFLMMGALLLGTLTAKAVRRSVNR